jgi:putative ABC transport system permease protein
MRGLSASPGGGQLFRKGLVVFQFALSVMLIIGTVVVYLQLQHMQDKELGFDEERVVVMPITQTLIAWEFQNFKERALASPHILEVTGSSKVLASEKQQFSKYSPANQPSAPPTNMFLDVTYDFLDTYSIDLLAGRSFSRDYPTDSEQAILINEAMLKQIDVETPQDAIGKTFYYTTAEDERKTYNVIGVVENFNYTSIKKEIDPLVINLIEGVRPTVRNIEFASVKLAPNGIRDGLTDLETAWKEVNHIDPFTYFFHDEELQKIYASETKMSKIASIFTLLCILVACLGLFGLSSFTSSLRIKEIGIRKTLGATVTNIVALLSKDYLKPVLLANIIAWPVIYYLAAQWLQDFPYRISLGWNLALVYLVVGIASMLICMGTVSYQSIRAALVNPVDSIKRE